MSVKVFLEYMDLCRGYYETPTWEGLRAYALRCKDCEKRRK